MLKMLNLKMDRWNCFPRVFACNDGERVFQETFIPKQSKRYTALLG